MTIADRVRIQLIALVFVVSPLLCIEASGSILTNVPAGGWSETQPGGGKWDDQNTNNPGPFPNISAALSGASLPSGGLTKVVKINDPDTTGMGSGVNFTINMQGTTAGSWTIDQNDLSLPSGKVLAYFSLKAAKSWNLWEIMPDTDLDLSTYTNSWDTNSSGGGLLTPNGNGFAGLSHISFWAIDGPPTPDPMGGPIPEPMSFAVWSLLAVAGTCVSRRHR